LNSIISLAAAEGKEGKKAFYPYPSRRPFGLALKKKEKKGASMRPASYGGRAPWLMMSEEEGGSLCLHPFPLDPRGKKGKKGKKRRGKREILT